MPQKYSSVPIQIQTYSSFLKKISTVKKLKYTLPETKRRITIRKLREDLTYDAKQYKKYSRLLKEGNSTGKILTESQIHGQFINEIKNSVDRGLSEGILDTGIAFFKRRMAAASEEYKQSKADGDAAASARAKKKYEDAAEQAKKSAAAAGRQPAPTDGKKDAPTTPETDTKKDSISTTEKSVTSATKLEDVKLTPEQAVKVGAAALNTLTDDQKAVLKKLTPEQIAEFVKTNSAKLDTAGEKIADKISATTPASDDPKAKGFFGKMFTWAKANPMKATAALALITTIGVAASIGSGGLAPLIMNTIAASAIGAAKGGAVGALGGAAVDIYKQKTDPNNKGKPMDWKRTGKAALSGAKSGAIGGGAMGGLSAVGGAAMQGVSGLAGQATNAASAAASASPGATSVADRALHAAGKGALRGAGMAGLGAGARDIYKQAKDPNGKGIDLRQTARAAGRGAVVGAVGGGLAGGAMSLGKDILQHLSTGTQNMFSGHPTELSADEIQKNKAWLDQQHPERADASHALEAKQVAINSLGLTGKVKINPLQGGGFEIDDAKGGKHYFDEHGATLKGNPADGTGHVQASGDAQYDADIKAAAQTKIFSKLGIPPDATKIRNITNGIVGVMDSRGKTHYYHGSTGNELANASQIQLAKDYDHLHNPDMVDANGYKPKMPISAADTERMNIREQRAARDNWLVAQHRDNIPHQHGSQPVAPVQQTATPTAADTGNPQFMKSPENPTGLYNLKPINETKLFSRSSIPNMFRLS